MSSELRPRPRRAIRATTKVPVELTSTNLAKSRTSAIGTSLANRISGVEVSHAIENGKRSAPPEDGDINASSEKMETLREPNEATGKSKNRLGKTRTAKSHSMEERFHDIDFILTNPKSPLVNMDLSEVIEYGTWMALSPESRERLSKLLPDVSFGNQMRELDSFHPSRRKVEDHSADPPPYEVRNGDELSKSHRVLAEDPSHRERRLDPSFFKDPHFESAVRTFQDHLYTGWFTSAHHDLVEKHLSGIRDGSLHAPWKDELWERDHPEVAEGATNLEATTNDHPNLAGAGSDGRRAKERASEYDLLVRKGFLKQGDIITLKHKFTAFGITVEKDALISAIHPRTSALTLTSGSGETRDLPPGLLAPFPGQGADLGSLLEMTVSNATQLVTALLDIDGRIPRTERPRLETRKILSVWQWPADAEAQPVSFEEAMLLERGGRESLGTLFYLRGQALDD